MPRRRKGSARAKPSPASNLKYVERTRNRHGEEYLYYRRDGRRIPLPVPYGSADFHAGYEAAAAQWAPVQRSAGHTVGDAITAFMASADWKQLSKASQRDYAYYLRNFRDAFGDLAIASLDSAWLEELRDKWVEQPNYWNTLRARMTAVVDEFMRRHPGALIANPWRASRRLKVQESDQNRPWPRAVLTAVFAAASPEFRALLTAYLLTAQRGGDVTKWTWGQYDEQASAITFRQSKTGKAMVLFVPEQMARDIKGVWGDARPQPGKSRVRAMKTFAAAPADSRPLFITERGRAWTLDNAQQMLARILRDLGLPRYTLHGLRSTGPSALRAQGWANAALRPLTGHDSDSNLEVYLRHADVAPLTKEAQEALTAVFAELIVADEVPKRCQPIQPDLQKI